MDRNITDNEVFDPKMPYLLDDDDNLSMDEFTAETQSMTDEQLFANLNALYRFNTHYKGRPWYDHKTHKEIHYDKVLRLVRDDEKRMFKLATTYEEVPYKAFNEDILAENKKYSAWSGQYFHHMNTISGFMGGSTQMGETMKYVSDAIGETVKAEENIRRTAKLRKDTSLWIYFLLLGVALILASGSSLPVVPDFFSELLRTNLIAKLILFIPAVLTGFGLFSLAQEITESDVNRDRKVHTFPIKMVANHLMVLAAALVTPAFIIDGWNHGEFFSPLLWISGVYYVLLFLTGIIDDCFVPKRRHKLALKDLKMYKDSLCSSITNIEKRMCCYILLNKHLWTKFAVSTQYPDFITRLEDSLAYMRAIRDNEGEPLPPPDRYKKDDPPAKNKKAGKKAEKKADEKTVAQAPAAKFCTKCGSKLTPDSKFCSQCGKSV